MKKNIIANFLSVVLTALLSVGIWLMLGVPWLVILEYLVVGVCYLSFGLMIDDFITKLLNPLKRAYLTWQYYITDLFVAAAAVSLYVAARSESIPILVLGLSGVVGFTLLAGIWAYFVYRKSVLSPFEIESEVWKKYQATFSEKRDLQKTVKELSSFLRFHLESNDPNKGLDLGYPLDPKNYMTVDELTKAGADSDYLKDLNRYLEVMASKIISKGEN